MNGHTVVAFTTVRQGDALNLVEKVRSEVFLDTAKALSEVEIPCVAIFIDCEDIYLETMRQLSVTAVSQTSSGMGNVRREALRSAMALFPQALYYFWLEPEKPNMPNFVESIVNLMECDQADLGLFNRISLDSYPEEQAHYYLFCRVVAGKLIGFDLDYAFGPAVMSQRAMQYFLEYGGEYGDKWESILIPRLRAIRSGLGVSILPINFTNDPRMTVAESGNPSIILKRVEQLNNVVPSLITEWQKLNS